MTQDPDPRPASDDTSDHMKDATNQGASTQEPAEGADDAPAEDDDSPQG